MGLTLLDTGVVIGILDADDAFHAAAHDAIARRMRTGAFFCLSAVSYAELLTGVEIGHQDASIVHRFLDDFSVGVLPVDDAVAEEAARIRGGTRSDGGRRTSAPAMKMSDALILATAVATPGVEEVVVADRAWPRIDVGVSVHLLAASPGRAGR